MYSQAYVSFYVKVLRPPSLSVAVRDRGLKRCLQEAGWAREKSRGSGQNAQHGWKGGHPWMRLERTGEAGEEPEGIIPNCVLHERTSCAPMSEDRSHEETLHLERCARKPAWDLTKNIHKLWNSDKTTFLFLVKEPEDHKCMSLGHRKAGIAEGVWETWSTKFLRKMLDSTYSRRKEQEKS